MMDAALAPCNAMPADRIKDRSEEDRSAILIRTDRCDGGNRQPADAGADADLGGGAGKRPAPRFDVRSEWRDVREASFLTREQEQTL